MGEGHLPKFGKARQKQLAVTPHYGLPGPDIAVQRRRMSDMLADQNAVIPGVAKGGADDGVDRGQSPGRNVPQPGPLLGRQRLGQGGMGRQGGELAGKGGQLTRTAIDGKHGLARYHLAMGRGDANAARVVHPQCRAAFIQGHIVRQLVGQSPHQGGRIEQHGIGGIDGGVVEAGTEAGRERRPLQILIAFVQQIQLAGVLLEQAGGSGLDGAVVFAALLPVAIDAIAADPVRQLGQSPFQQLPVVAGLGQLGVATADIVGQVDGEPRVAPGGVVPHHTRLQQHYAGLWLMLGQRMGKGQPGIARPYHHPVPLDHPLQRRTGKPLGQDGGPAIGLFTAGKITKLHGASCSCICLQGPRSGEKAAPIKGSIDNQ
ncbi:hypothetical protein D3C77_432300 [compost metagenome]